MNKNLLIVGAGIYAVVAWEIAEDMGCFEKIDFVDDTKETAPNGNRVVGTTRDLGRLATEYSNIIVAIGEPKIRNSLLNQIKEETEYNIVSLVSPKAYVARSAQVEKGCIIEPMAVVHSLCVIAEGCIISSGAVINHAGKCAEAVHVDCNATVAGHVLVPAGEKVKSGQVYDK